MSIGSPTRCAAKLHHRSGLLPLLSKACVDLSGLVCVVQVDRQQVHRKIFGGASLVMHCRSPDCGRLISAAERTASVLPGDLHSSSDSSRQSSSTDGGPLFAESANRAPFRMSAPGPSPQTSTVCPSRSRGHLRARCRPLGASLRSPHPGWAGVRSRPGLSGAGAGWACGGARVGGRMQSARDRWPGRFCVRGQEMARLIPVIVPPAVTLILVGYLLITAPLSV